MSWFTHGFPIFLKDHFSMLHFNIDKFIREEVTKRKESLFTEDLEQNRSELKERINNRRVLVIGGAGTIGSNYIKAILPYRPRSLTVVDYSENGLTELTRDLRSRKELPIPSSYITYPFDFGSTVFEKLMAQYNFDIISCFAAHKHVRSEKDRLAIESMVVNNIFNTKKLLDLTKERLPEHLFSVSTDKATNPVNIMGATKKIMEKVLMAYSNEMKITTARFANVAFSNGSLLDGFIYRIMKRQPLSSPIDVKRYFVSPIESGQLCLIASILGKTGEIFFPKLNPEGMMTFSNIAERFLFTIGLKPEYCDSEMEAKIKASTWTESNPYYPVYFFKTETSGEKPFEEFYEENVDLVNLNQFKQLGVITNSEKPTLNSISSIVTNFKDLFESKEIQKSDIIDLLNKYLPDFNHIETGKNLDQKM